MFIKVNATLAEFGQDQVDAPPGYPAFGEVAPQNLTATNTGGVVTLKLTRRTSPGQNTIIRASAPQSAGRSVCKDLRILGTCPVPAAGSADITSLYTAKFGAPAVGTKIFVQASQMDSGFETISVEFTAIVPASGWWLLASLWGPGYWVYQGLTLGRAPLLSIATKAPTQP